MLVSVCCSCGSGESEARGGVIGSTFRFSFAASVDEGGEPGTGSAGVWSAILAWGDVLRCVAERR